MLSLWAITLRAVKYARDMGRWPPDAGERLRAAAIELFLEQGFAATTVPDIAKRAGLTTRSFFRYYADKREVLFVGEEELPNVVAQVFASADSALAPLDVVRYGILAVLGPRLEPLRGELGSLMQIISTDEGLQERHLRKMSILQAAATAAFRERGLVPLEAEVAGRLATSVYDMTLAQWLGSQDRTFLEVSTQVLDTFPAVIGSAHCPPCGV